MKKFYIIIVIIIILIGGLTYYILNKEKPTDTSVDDIIAEAEKYLENKQYSKALEQYKLAINTDPSKTDAYLKASDIYISKSKDNEATELLKNGVNSVTNPDDVHYKIGTILFDNYDVEGALEYFEKAYKENPNNWQNSIELVKTYSYYSDRKEDSIKVLNKIKTEENDGLRMKNYYLALLHSDDADKMISYLEDTSSLNDDSIKESINQLLQTAKKIKSDPDDIVQNNTLLAYEMISSELYNYSISLLDTVIGENDEYYAAYMYKGICYINMNDYDNAVENLSTSVAIDPDQVQPNLFLAQVYTMQNNQKDAIDTYEKALTLEPDNESVRYDYTESLISFGLYSQAKHQYTELINMESDNKLKYIIELTEIEIDYLENFTEALESIKEATIDSSNFSGKDSELKSKALDMLGWANLKNGQKDEALKYFNQSQEIYPYLAKSYYHLGILYNEIDNDNEAKINFERAIDLDLSGQISSKASSELENMSHEDTTEN